MKKEFKEIFAKDRTEFRKWLKKNHDSTDGIWLVMYKKKTKKESIDWAGAVKEALCFGWIDSLKKSIDDEKWKQKFTPRKAKSVWSKVNKNYIKELIENNLMTEAGLRSIAIAKENGSWEKLDKIEALEIPEELLKEFKKYPNAKKNYDAFPKTVKKSILYYLDIKNKEERLKRIQDTARLAEENIRNDFLYRDHWKKKKK